MGEILYTYYFYCIIRIIGSKTIRIVKYANRRYWNQWSVGL